MRIGIDVGGTNTDAVLLDDRQVLAAVKTSTTEDVTTGIVTALASLQRQRPFDPADVRAWTQRHRDREVDPGPSLLYAGRRGRLRSQRRASPSEVN